MCIEFDGFVDSICCCLVMFCVCFRKLYWTDQGTESGIPAKVASADMDGSNPMILFTHNLEHVEFITIDIKENKLYWSVTGTGVVRPVLNKFDNIC